MKRFFLFFAISSLFLCCHNKPLEWDGPAITKPRTSLTSQELLQGRHQEFLDMSYFTRPSWGTEAHLPFSGRISIAESGLNFPKEKAYYPGENIFPAIQLDFISANGMLVPRIKDKIITRKQSESYWDVIAGAGKVWHEEEDGAWDRASFPLTLTDRWAGQARNCVATFVYKADSISSICIQCSQETADIDDKQLGNINGTLPARYFPQLLNDSAHIIENHLLELENRLPIFPLSEIDRQGQLAGYFEKMIHTNAPTSLGAVWVDSSLYLHPPKTRHGLYPYPEEMRHGLYSVTKSMAGALALMYFEERYPDGVFEAHISDYVPALAEHPGWQGVTFGHTLNMVTGTVGSERLEHFFSTVIAHESAEDIINSIAKLGDSPEAPGEKFNYASANLFVLSYALQQFVKAHEGEDVNYWDLVRENVLTPIGAGHFSLLLTIEENDKDAIPILALGALPTIDEAAKIALLFQNGGSHNGVQLLNRQRVLEAMGKTDWSGYSTNGDFRGTWYRHSFWVKSIRTDRCTVNATYMLGFGENYVVFLPSGAILFRFLDEHDLNIDELIRRLESIKSSCP